MPGSSTTFSKKTVALNGSLGKLAKKGPMTGLFGQPLRSVGTFFGPQLLASCLLFFLTVDQMEYGRGQGWDLTTAKDIACYQALMILHPACLQ
jgi:hypothetical protein